MKNSVMFQVNTFKYPEEIFDAELHGDELLQEVEELRKMGRFPNDNTFHVEETIRQGL